VITDITILLLAPVAGFFAALWLLLLWLGDGRDAEVPVGYDPAIDDATPVGAAEPHEPFVPMPDHLKTREEMVSWMTKELPKHLQAYGE
jgi:hypothetical protein